MGIEDIDDFSEEYIGLVESNSDIFDSKIYDIFLNTKNKFGGIIGLNNGVHQELEFFIKEDKLFLEKIIARGKGKQIMFLLLYYALKNDLDIINLKAEPLRLLENEETDDRKKYLRNFYGYFGFKILNLLGNMSLKFDDEYISDFIIIFNRLNNFINESKIKNT